MKPQRWPYWSAVCILYGKSNRLAYADCFYRYSGGAYLIFGGRSGLFTGDPLYHVLAGGLMLGAFYGYLTMLPLRLHPRSVNFWCGLWHHNSTYSPLGWISGRSSYSILLMNLVVPFIERWTAPKVYGMQSVRV